MNKTVQFETLGGPEVLTFVDAPAPSPKAGEVQIAVKAAGLNRAELLFIAGQYLIDPVLPSGAGVEGAGDIIAIGPEVDRFAVGDRVAITPGFNQLDYVVLGETVNMSAAALEPIADDMSYVEAAAFWMAFGTAYGLLVQQGGLRQGAGQYVVMNAASSSVGTAAFQIIKAHGGVSIATTRTHDKVAALKAAGADHVIVTEAENVVARVMEITQGHGFDIACDAVMGADGATLANAAAVGATFVIYGLLSGEISPMPFGPMLSHGLNVVGFHLVWLLLDVPERRNAAVDHLTAGLARGDYAPVIDKVFPFDQVADAYRHMASNT
ncbi:zinc-dependent alcohol dehydrogenase family protein [Jannaschia sp. CCS1]|uniref:zinc-dependent alcohol dehydrogenase family protein n=1 Tax=Jannaschia sp. (strain CCS1) TaxID=290400 RepID=UPI000053D7BF|nr:zinc-dependent alcohol dehydrogenase family protein [Jannaschia sp. CCS1]ABD55539.1 Alcohol dehydrogenase zinc-binding protein [Jannaschia sp. CCS1]